MAAFFVDSPEFESSYGTLSDLGFVRQIYRNVLGREGEASGVDFWAGQLAGGASRSTILMRFAESPENITNSGTSQPTLGAFNEGLSSRWSCPEWFEATQPPSPVDGCWILPERWNNNAPSARVTVTNSNSYTARATVWTSAIVNGVLEEPTGTQIPAIRPGEQVDSFIAVGRDAAKTADLLDITCEIQFIRWSEDPIVPVADGCVLGGLTSQGLRRFTTTVTNPLLVPATGLVTVLPSLDGRRIDHQIGAVESVPPGATRTSSSVITSGRLRDVPIGRVDCVGVNILWLRD